MQRTENNRTKTILKQDSKSSKEDQNIGVVANPPGSSSNLWCCCRSAAAPLLLCYGSAMAPLSLHCIAPAVATQSLLLSPPLLLRYCSDVASLLLCCRFCRDVATAVSPVVATLSLLLSLLLPLHCYSGCHSGVALVSLRYPYVISLLFLRCCSATAAVTPAVTPAVTALLSLRFFTFVASRGRIMVTVFIGDCQARVSSSLQGCSTLQKTVKVESY